MKKWLFFVVVCLAVCVGCQWQLRPSSETEQGEEVAIARFDRMETLYLSTGDLAALQQMKTNYPTETRTLIEDVLQLGHVDEADINARFYQFFQDSTLQSLMLDVDSQYRDVSDLDRQLSEAFVRLRRYLPDLAVPRVYAQVGSLNESIVVGDAILGVSLDKYLGENHPVYLKYGYTEDQRRMMTRRYIVPDCLGFYLLSLYPMSDEVADSLPLRSAHIGRIQWVVNQAIGYHLFTRESVQQTDVYMKAHPHMSIDDLLKSASRGS